MFEPVTKCNNQCTNEEMEEGRDGYMKEYVLWHRSRKSLIFVTILINLKTDLHLYIQQSFDGSLIIQWSIDALKIIAPIGA